MLEKTELTFKEVVELIEYKNNNKRYWNKSKLYKQVINKAFLIAEDFYLRYLLIFLFKNTISHLVLYN